MFPSEEFRVEGAATDSYSPTGLSPMIAAPKDRTGPAQWGDSIVRRDADPPFLQFEPRPQHLRDLLRESSQHSSRDHVVDGDRRRTFGQFQQDVHSMTDLLADLGVRHGDRVLILGWNSLDWVVAFWAVVQSGAVAVLGNSWWTRAEVAAAIQDCDPRLVLVDEAHAKLVGSDRPTAILSLEALSIANRQPRLEDGNEPTGHIVDENDAATIIFTAGSSGRPKGVVLSHRSLIAQHHSTLYMAGRLPGHQSHEDPVEVTLVTGPLFHVAALQIAVRAMIVGGVMVFLPGKIEPAAVADAIEREQVTRWGGVPTVISRMITYLAAHPRDMRSIRRITLGGASVPPSLVARAREAFPCAEAGVAQLYGMTEAGGSLTYASGRGSLSHPGSSGRALPLVELRIDRPGEDGVGEIMARSPTIMSGYWGVAVSPVSADGWLLTGDLGRIDDDGFLYVVGRSKDVIIRGGENVSPAHVEATLTGHPDVLEAVVLPVPDPDLGERVGAVLRLTPESLARGEDVVAHVLTYTRELLAYFEIPEVVLATDQPFPVTAASKVDRPKLARMLLERRFVQ